MEGYEDREIKFRFVFKHPEHETVRISQVYSLREILQGITEEDIRDHTLCCDCESVGETNVIDCNCDEYYEKFDLVDTLEYTGQKDKHGVEIYEGYIVDWENGRGDVFFDGDEGKFVHGFQEKIDGKLTSWYRPCKRMWNRVEVIGDVYSSPNLIGGCRVGR